MRWRKRIGEEGVETLLMSTIDAARRGGVVKISSADRVIVDTTVMPKAIVHPTDSRLLEKDRQQLVKVDEEHGIALDKLSDLRAGATRSKLTVQRALFRRHEQVLVIGNAFVDTSQAGPADALFERGRYVHTAAASAWTTVCSWRTTTIFPELASSRQRAAEEQRGAHGTHAWTSNH